MCSVHGCTWQDHGNAEGSHKSWGANKPTQAMYCHFDMCNGGCAIAVAPVIEKSDALVLVNVSQPWTLACRSSGLPTPNLTFVRGSEVIVMVIIMFIFFVVCDERRMKSALSTWYCCVVSELKPEDFCVMQAANLGTVFPDPLSFSWLFKCKAWLLEPENHLATCCSCAHIMLLRIHARAVVHAHIIMMILACIIHMQPLEAHLHAHARTCIQFVVVFLWHTRLLTQSVGCPSVTLMMIPCCSISWSLVAMSSFRARGTRLGLWTTVGTVGSRVIWYFPGSFPIPLKQSGYSWIRLSLSMMGALTLLASTLMLTKSKACNIGQPNMAGPFPFVT